MKTVSEAYILGIKDARETLKAFPDICAKTEIEGNARLMRQHSDDMKQFFKGARDFWRNQAKKGQ